MNHKLPFEPTNCDCAKDQANCTQQPGHLLPGQLPEILEHLNVTADRAAEYFWNSPGMVLGSSKTAETFRIRTITPRFKDGKCVFFKEGLCQIHDVAPFGCRYFDVHMTEQEANRRAMVGVNLILDNQKQYEAERYRLSWATHYKPKRVQ